MANETPSRPPPPFMANAILNFHFDYLNPSLTFRQILSLSLRDGVKKSKWKFKMAFAMKGGGLEGVSSATYLF